MCACAGKGHLHTARYTLLPGDLRDVQGVHAALLEAGLQADQPTLVLAECVLVYMQPAESVRLVRHLGSLLTTAAFLVYEQLRPDDAFGQQMLLNLEVGGQHLLWCAAPRSMAVRCWTAWRFSSKQAVLRPGQGCSECTRVPPVKPPGHMPALSV